MEAVDVGWFTKKVVRPDGSPRRYGCGPLRRFDLELDAYYFGVPYENIRRRRFAGVYACCLLMLHLANWANLLGPDVAVATVTEPEPLDTTLWIRHLHSIWDHLFVNSSSAPAGAVDFRLDIVRALARLPRSQRNAFVLFMDGYSLEQIARRLGWKVSSVERAVRRASTRVRELCALDVPGQAKRQPRPVKRGTDVIASVELEIEAIRKEMNHHETQASSAA